MRNLWRGQRGAALVTVMLFMVLLLILITAMLTVAGNEAVISGLQRDGVRALELAQGGVQEAIRRIEEGRPFQAGFTSSLGSGVTVSVVRRVLGTNSAYQEIQVTATVGRATRRLSHLVLQRMVMFPPNIMFAPGLEPEGQNIHSGDTYARTYVAWGDPQIDPVNNFTYAGWRIRRDSAPTGVGPCYNRTQAGCSTGEAVNWFPGTRRGESQTTVLGDDIEDQTTKCPAGGGGSLPSGSITGVPASAETDCQVGSCAPFEVTIPLYGFDTDDPDGAGPIAPQAVTPKLPCGLPYKWVSETFTREGGGGPYTRLFKTVVFEQWFDNYWQFVETQMTYVRKSNLVSYPQFGAVPPVLDAATIYTNPDAVLTGGGSVTQASTDWGCKHPEMSCPGGVSRPVTILLDGTPDVTNWTVSGILSGHGTLVVRGNLSWAVAGTFKYWGTIIVLGTVDGSLCLCNPGPNEIHGGIVSTKPYWMGDATEVWAGGTVTSVPVGRSIVVGKAWWER